MAGVVRVEIKTLTPSSRLPVRSICLNIHLQRKKYDEDQALDFKIYAIKTLNVFFFVTFFYKKVDVQKQETREDETVEFTEFTQMELHFYYNFTYAFIVGSCYVNVVYSLWVFTWL